MYNKELRDKASKLLALCHKRGVKITVAESCTGGLLAGLLTEIPNCSPVFEFGFVTYSNEAKTELLDVRSELIEAHGAVSGEVAKAMAEGALRKAYAGVSCAITGIAGPSGGTKQKPVGLVYIAVATPKKVTVKKNNFKGTRTEIRLSAVSAALEMLLKENPMTKKRA